MNAVVTGHLNGLGKAIYDRLVAEGHSVFGIDLPQDIRDLAQMKKAAVDAIAHHQGAVDVLVNCAGVNLIGYLEDFREEDWDTVVDTNAKGIFVVTKAFLDLLKCTRGTVCNIVSNASHMPMTGSLAYNASKGAAHIMTLQLARELTKRHGITVFGVSPNKLAGTAMSIDIDRQVCESRGWTLDYAKEYQLKALLTGEETDPQAVAEFVVWLLSDKRRHKYLSGCILPYGA
jgi:NAD(P)-dependent dehydrogenase (short-subunit alcohol dehydrogenase family)